MRAPISQFFWVLPSRNIHHRFYSRSYIFCKQTEFGETFLWKAKSTKYKKIIAELTLSHSELFQLFSVFVKHQVIKPFLKFLLRKCQNRIKNVPVLNTEANDWLTCQAKRFFSTAHDKTIDNRQLWTVTKWHSTNPNLRIKQLLITNDNNIYFLF